MGILFNGSKKETCSICGETFISCYRLKDKNKICKNCIKKLGGFWTSNWVNMTQKEVIESFNKQNNQFDGVINITIGQNTQLTEDDKTNIEKRERETKLWKENNKKYHKYISESLSISEEIFEKGLYSKAINQANINNKYADRYIELCNRLLQLLPYEIEHDKKDAKIRNQEYQIRGMGNHLVNFIRLLEKQEKYNEIINVSRYLLSLGITEDGTKKGIKGRIEKAITKFNQKFNTNYIYKPDEDLIIDTNTGEIME